MHTGPIPLHQFQDSSQLNIGFEIGQLENMTPLAQSPLPHRHTFYELFWLTSGAGSHWIDFKSYPLHPHTMFFITPGQIHYWQVEESARGCALLFTQDFLLLNRFDPTFLRSLDFYHQLDNQPVLYLDSPKAEQFQQLCHNMQQEYKTAQFGRTNAIQSFLQILLIQAQRHYTATSSPADDTTAYALAHSFSGLVDLHFQTKQAVEDYAALLGITPDYLTEVTKQATGLTASQLVHRRISLEAKRLLAHTARSVGEICYDLNFKDPSYFSRFFKRETGQTPQLFRQGFQEKYQKSLD